MFKKYLIFLCLFCLAKSAFAHPGIEHWQTSSGVRVYFVESRDLPILDIELDFAAGSSFDPPGKEGLAGMTNGLLDLGADDLDETVISNRLADIGAHLGNSLEEDRASISLRTLSHPEKQEAALAVFKKIIERPNFDEGILKRERTRNAASLKDDLSRPDVIASRAFWSLLYPEHPYGCLSTPESLSSIEAEDVRAFWQSRYTANNATLSIVGNLSKEEAKALAENLTAALPRGETLPPLKTPAVAKGQTIKLPHPASQTHIYIGMPAIARGDPDAFPLTVGNYILGGGGFVSRLMAEVREKRGYVYSIYSYFQPLKQKGPFMVGLQTQQPKEALEITRQVLLKFLEEGPTPKELEAAKANLVGGFPLRLDSNQKILNYIAVIGFYGLPLDYLETYQARIKSVSAKDILNAFSRHIQPENLITVIVAGNQETKE